MTGPIDVVALVPSAWMSLRSRRTRWAHVVGQWARDPRVGRVTVVDPAVTRLTGARRMAGHGSSWDPEVSVIQARLPLSDRVAAADPLAMALVARALRHRLPPPVGPRLVMCAHPVWAPVMLRVPSDRHGFDAFDDWRSYARAARLRPRIVSGYAALTRFDTVTTNTAVMQTRLREDFGVSASVVPNGVDLAAHVSPGDFPVALPEPPFAVYVGVIEERVDLDLLLAASEALHPTVPVVVAGPADASAQERLRSSKAVWLGPIDSAFVPGLLARASVGLLPHRVNAFTASMDPMKLLEYLAAGLRVVATPVALPTESQRITVAESPAEFAEAVSRGSRLQRIGAPDPAVLDRDWSSVARELLTAHLP